MVYRAKWQIALEQYRRAVANGVRFAWLTFDEGYGSKPPFLRELDALGQNYVAEVPVSFHVWTKRPAVLYRDPPGPHQGPPRALSPPEGQEQPDGGSAQRPDLFAAVLREDPGRITTSRMAPRARWSGRSNGCWCG